MIEPSKLATEQVEERDSLLPDDFDLIKFNQCVPERRAVLDHPNKEIAVCTIVLSCLILTDTAIKIALITNLYRMLWIFWLDIGH